MNPKICQLYALEPARLNPEERQREQLEKSREIAERQEKCGGKGMGVSFQRFVVERMILLPCWCLLMLKKTMFPRLLRCFSSNVHGSKPLVYPGETEGFADRQLSGWPNIIQSQNDFKTANPYRSPKKVPLVTQQIDYLRSLGWPNHPQKGSWSYAICLLIAFETHQKPIKTTRIRKHHYKNIPKKHKKTQKPLRFWPPNALLGATCWRLKVMEEQRKAVGQQKVLAYEARFPTPKR